MRWARVAAARTSARGLRLPLVVFVLLALLPDARLAAAEPVELRLRIAWGNGAYRQWRGEIRTSEGAFSDVVRLGLEADEVAAVVPRGAVIQIAHRSPRSYDGVDVTIRATLNATISVELSPHDQPLALQRVAIPLSDLVTGTSETPLDEQDNRLLIRRAPGDQLRVEFDRPSLVFSAGEPFDVHIRPHLLGFSAGTTLRLNVVLAEARGGDELSRVLARDLHVGEDGNVEPLEPLRVDLPVAEGVYDLVFSLTQRRLTDAIVRTRPNVQRTVQLVVLENQPAAPASVAPEWQEEARIDPANPGWRDWLTRLPQWKMLPGVGKPVMNNGRSKEVTHQGHRLTQLDPEGWQAFPLPIEHVDQPHLLEIAYPGDHPQTLGISIVEPNEAGLVVPIGVDSGVEVPDSLSPPRMQRHSLVFWPRTTAPLVLLTNRRDDTPALFGSIRLLGGPSGLPAAIPVAAKHERLLAAYYDKPLFPENFSAAEAVDPWTEHTLDDWKTFYDGGRRLVEYLKYAGYNGAIITVACEGSAIYPSDLLQPTPKYDTGTFFVSGQDARRKDVLEVLFRLFDREGLRLVPAIQFASPLPELEELLQRGGNEAVGIELIAADQRPWMLSSKSRRGLGPYYNPLHPRVQSEMRRVVAELTDRYCQHSAFAGVALQLGTNTFGVLPGDKCGYDPHTVNRFLSQHKGDMAGYLAQPFEQRVEFLQGDALVPWLEWRSQTLARLHYDLQSDIVRRRPGAKLYLVTSDLLSGEQEQRALRPSLPRQANISHVLLRLGIDIQKYRSNDDILLLRPQRLAPSTSLATQGVNLELATMATVDEYFRRGGAVGNLFYHEPLPLSLPSFDATNPFGAENTQTWFLPHIPATGIHNRRRFVHAVASMDAQAIVDGGWLLPLGQEESLRSVFETYRRLPVGTFATFEPPGAPASSQPVVMRTQVRGDRTYFYLANDSAWPVTVDVEWEVPASCQLQSLSSRPLPRLDPRSTRNSWSVQLEPYDLVGGMLTSHQVSIPAMSVSLGRDIAPALHQQLYDVRARTNALQNPPPLKTLHNPDFELAPSDGQLPGWIHSPNPAVNARQQVEVDESQSRSGTKSLRLKSDGGVVWLRSIPVESPRTGRMAVWAWLRVSDPDRQPRLLLAIEGRLNGEVYYRHAEVGRNNPRAQAKLSPQWKPFILPVDDLPSGLTDLRVGFDLHGAGEVWIDDIQLFDLWFQPNERHELTINIALAERQLQNGRVSDCQRFLDGYWPRFLMEFVQLDENRVANVPREPQLPAPPLPASSGEEKPSVWNRVRDIMPKKLLPF